MNVASDAAEQIVRISLESAEFAVKLAGKGAERLLAMIMAALNDPKPTKGKTRLVNMLRSEKPLTVFSIKDEELKRFCKEAKNYGVLYCVLKDRDVNDGITDLLVRQEDRGKINRIFERFQLTTGNVSDIKADVQAQQKAAEDIPVPERPQVAEEKADAFLDLLMAKPPNAQQQQTENPTEGRMARSRQSEPTSKPKESFETGTNEVRPSVREELKKIREEKMEAEERSTKRKKKSRSASQKSPKANHPKSKNTKEK